MRLRSYANTTTSVYGPIPIIGERKNYRAFYACIFIDTFVITYMFVK